MPLQPMIDLSEPVTYDNHRNFFLWPEDTGDGDGVYVTFLGVNSLYIDDGDKGIMIDPFFTRPQVRSGSMLVGPRTEARRTERHIGPNADIIGRELDRAEVPRVDAFLMTHAHWDHAMDIAEVWKYFKRKDDGGSCKIFGDRSIFNIVRGGYQQWEAAGDTEGLDDVEAHFQEVSEDATFTIGAFSISFLRGSHVNLPVWIDYNLRGEIEQPLLPPVSVQEYKKGNIFSIYIKHGEHGSILNQGSANYNEGYYAEIFGPGKTYPYPDINIPGIAGFNSGWMYGVRRLHRWRRRYYREAIAATRAKRVLLSHWDEFNSHASTLNFTLKWMHDAHESRGLLYELRNHYYEQDDWEIVRPQPNREAAEAAERGTGIQSGRRWEFRRLQIPPIHFLPLGYRVKVLPARPHYTLFRRRVSD